MIRGHIVLTCLVIFYDENDKWYLYLVNAIFYRTKWIKGLLVDQSNFSRSDEKERLPFCEYKFLVKTNWRPIVFVFHVWYEFVKTKTAGDNCLDEMLNSER